MVGHPLGAIQRHSQMEAFREGPRSPEASRGCVQGVGTLLNRPTCRKDALWPPTLSCTDAKAGVTSCPLCCLSLITLNEWPFVHERKATCRCP